MGDRGSYEQNGVDNDRGCKDASRDARTGAEELVTEGKAGKTGERKGAGANVSALVVAAAVVTVHPLLSCLACLRNFMYASSLDRYQQTLTRHYPSEEERVSDRETSFVCTATSTSEKGTTPCDTRVPRIPPESSPLLTDWEWRRLWATKI